MTTLQLAQRLTRNLTHTDVRTLPPDEQQRLLDAINTGLAEYVELLPDLRRSEPKQYTFSTPFTEALTCTNGSTAVVFDRWPKQNLWIGNTVTVASDPSSYQRLVALNTLAAAHHGPTGDTVLTVYSDIVQFDGYADAVDTINGELLLQEGSTRHRLMHGSPMEWHGMQPLALELGLPRWWWIEPLTGMNGLDAPIYVLRVWPVPVTTYTLIYNLRIFPVAVSMLDLITSRVLPVPPIEETHLVNLCMPGMFGSKMWDERCDKKDIRADYERARQAMLPKLERSGSTAPNLCGTPLGW